MAGFDLTNGLSNISEWVAESVFSVEIYSSPTTSDSSAQFVQAFLLLIFAIPVTLLLKTQQRFSEDQIKQFLHTAAAYVLSFFLLKYGVDKLFQFQFYTPEPNTLFTSIGMLSKDILFWSSMGTSSSYNTFMGLIEVIPAFLLLHHRTRLLGALIALGVLINVLMINIGFDITVKLLSTYLVITALYVLSPFFKSLYSFFISNSHTNKPKMQLSLKPKVRAIIKALVVVLIFTEVLFSYVQIGAFNGREMEKIKHFGSYELMKKNASILGHKDVQRIHVHSKGYLILEDQTGNFTDFPIQIAPNNSIFIRNMNTQIHVIKHEQTVVFEILQDGESTSFKAEKYDLNQLPVNNDSFHWTVDGLIGSSKG